MNDQLAPKFIDIGCGDCDEETEHKVIKWKPGKRIHATLKCTVCGKTGPREIEQEKPVEVKVIISHGDESIVDKVMLSQGTYYVNDDIMVGERLCRITALECEEHRATQAPIDAVDTLWVKDITMVEVKVSLNLGRKTRAYEIVLDPYDILTVGEELELDRVSARISTIKTDQKRLTKDGRSAEAADIVRVYCKPARSRQTTS